MKKKTIIAVSVAFSAVVITLMFLYFIPKGQSKQYENNVKELIEIKTQEFIKYIDSYSVYAETEILTKSDLIEFKEENKTVFNIPVIQIDNDYYSLIAINELQNSMKIISSYLISKIKDVMIKGVNYQTEVYSKNIDNYVDWYYSYFTGINRTITNIIGFFTGEKSAVEKFYTDNFNRIMNYGADFDFIIEDDMNNLLNIIQKIFYEYSELKEYFSVNNRRNLSGVITNDDFLGAFTNDIVVYFENVYESLGNANSYLLQEYTIKGNNTGKTVKDSIRLLTNVSIFGKALFDNMPLNNRELLNRQELKQKIYDSMIENQNHKIEIIKDPFNYLFDKLTIGSVLYVDNYFAGINTYQHYGVYIGNGRVVHFAPLEGQEISMENGIIHETTLERFLNGRALQIDMNVEKRFSEDEIVRRAKSRMGEKGYSLLTNNCEHFSRWCVTGENISYQINNLPQKLDETLLIIRENYNMISEFFELFN